MKKYLALLLVLVLTLGLFAACGNTTPADTTPKDTTPATDAPTDTVTETVEETEKAFFIAAGGEPEFSQARECVVIRYGTGNIGFDHSFALIADNFYCIKSLFNDFRRFAFDHGAGQVAIVTGIVHPGENIYNNGRSGINNAAAPVVGHTALSAAGGDGSGADCIVGSQIGINDAAQFFAGEKFVVQSQSSIAVD